MGSTSDVARDFHFEYETVKGYFMQSEDGTDDTEFDFVSNLLHRICFSGELLLIPGKDQGEVWAHPQGV